MTKRVLRWILVLPAAVAAGLCVPLIVRLAGYSWWGQHAHEASVSFFGPVVFILAATYTAPSHRREVAVSSATLWLAVMLATMIYGWGEIDHSNLAWTLFKPLLSFGGAVGTTWCVWLELKGYPKPAVDQPPPVTFGDN